MSNNDINDIILDEIRELKKDFSGFRQELNGRVRSLEVWRGYLAGALAIAGILIGYILK